jgi:hypothetical protein
LTRPNDARKVPRMHIRQDASERYVLCSITTATIHGHGPMDRRAAVDESVCLGLTRFALFLTALDAEARRDYYRFLRQRRRMHNFTIPFVHARSDMHPDEYRMFMSEFGTERFNLHPVRKHLLTHELPEEIRAVTYVENLLDQPTESDYEGFAGICLDFAHLEHIRRFGQERYRACLALLERIPIGANHVSAYASEREGTVAEHRHWVESLEDFDYVRRFPVLFFGRFVAIEVNNPLSAQLEAANWLEAHLASL